MENNISLLAKERIIAKPDFNRWFVPPAALCIHLCIGMAYGFSVFWLPLTKALGKGEDEDAFRGRFPELFESLDENLALCKTIMGELMTWLESKVPMLPKLDYKGKKVTKYLDDETAREQLFDDGLVFRTDYPVDE